LKWSWTFWCIPKHTQWNVLLSLNSEQNYKTNLWVHFASKSKKQAFIMVYLLLIMPSLFCFLCKFFLCFLLTAFLYTFSDSSVINTMLLLLNHVWFRVILEKEHLLGEYEGWKELILLISLIKFSSALRTYWWWITKDYAFIIKVSELNSEKKFSQLFNISDYRYHTPNNTCYPLHYLQIHHFLELCYALFW